MIYIFLMVFCPVYFYVVRYKLCRSSDIVALGPVFVVIWAVLGLQAGVGTDFATYQQMAKGQLDLLWIERKNEFLFLWLNDLVIRIGEPQLIFVFSAGIQVAILYLIMRECEQLGLELHWALLLFFILLLVYFNSFNLVRQYTAVYLFVFSVFQLARERYIIFLSLVLIASFFHHSALYLAPLVALLKPLNARLPFDRVLKILLVLFLLSFLNWNAILAQVLKYTSYYSYSRNDYLARTEWLNIATKFPKIATVLLSAYVLDKKYPELSSRYRFFLNLSFLSIAVLVISFSSTAVWRVYQYFDFFTIFPLLILLSHNKERRITYPILGCLYFIFLLKVTVFAEGEYLYRSIFST